jgi:hypothetical protein
VLALFPAVAAAGASAFSLSYCRLRSWLRDAQGPALAVSDVGESALSELFDRAVADDGVRAEAPLGRHGPHMTCARRGEAQDPCAMLRHQFLQFLVLLAINWFPGPDDREHMLLWEPSHLRRSRSRQVFELHSAPFDAVHKLLRRVMPEDGACLAHRDFARARLLFPDVVAALERGAPLLRALFDRLAVKGHARHDFVPLAAWSHVAAANIADARLVGDQFALAKAPWVSFDDPDFCPGLRFHEFLHCIVRVAAVALPAPGPAATPKAAQPASPPGIQGRYDDGLAQRVDLLLELLHRPLVYDHLAFN